MADDRTEIDSHLLFDDLRAAQARIASLEGQLEKMVEIATYAGSRMAEVDRSTQRALAPDPARPASEPDSGYWATKCEDRYGRPADEPQEDNDVDQWETNGGQ